MKMFVAGLFIALALSGCGSPATPDSETYSGIPRLPAGELSEAAQMARIAACNARLEHYMQLRVWIAGGARPNVDRAAWDKLKPEERAEIFDIAACQDSGGQVAERFVTVVDGVAELETKRVANTRDFAKEFPAPKPAT